MPTARLGCGHGIAWTVLLAAADTSSAGPKCPSARVLHGSGALAKPGAKRQTQAGIAGWPGFDPDFAEESGLIEPYLSAIRVQPLLHQLKDGQEAGVLNLLEALPAQRPAAGLSLSQLLQRDLAYFQTHREHLHYQALAAKGSPIGTGAMESTCGQLQTRVKRTGQFWKPAGLPNLLALKAALQNDDWLALWSRN